MDNVTHSLVGAALAQGVLEWRAKGANSPERLKSLKNIAGPTYVASILANNFPDFDLLVTAVMQTRMSYILHHRGHTHTLLFAPIQLLLILGGLWIYSRWKQKTWTKSDWRWLTMISFLGCFVHIGMDSWNVYGVHPFWPINGRWFYGDFVFILEPLIWMSLIPWLVTRVERKWVKNLLHTFFVLGLVALLIFYRTMWWYPLGVALIALSFRFLVQTRIQREWQGLVSLSALVAILTSLLTSSLWARSELKHVFEKQHRGEKIRDIALQSFPSNPFCYSFVTVGYQAKKKAYIVRKGLYSFAPKVFACPPLGQGMTAPMKVLSKLPAIQRGGFLGKVHLFQRPVAELHQLAGNHCRVKAALKFIRAPYWKQTKRGVLFGDFRFDRRKSLDLADFYFKKVPTSCPSLLPPWIPPYKTQGF